MLFPGSKQHPSLQQLMELALSANPHLSNAQRLPRVQDGLKPAHLFQHIFHRLFLQGSFLLLSLFATGFSRMLRVPCTSGTLSQRMRGITAATLAAHWAGTSKSSPWSSPVPAQSCRRRDLLSHLAVPWLTAGTLRHASYGMGLSVMEGVGGQLPGLRGPLRVNGTIPSAAGSH